MSQVFDSVKDLSVNSNLKVSVYYLNTTSELAQKTLGSGYVDTNNKGSDIVSLWYEKFKKWGIKTYQLEDKIDISDNAEQEIGLTDNFSIIFKPFTTWGHVLRGESYISPEGRKVYDISCSHIDGNTLAIFCDGQIGICCEDYDAEINFGNIRDISLVDVLKSKKYKNVISNFKKGIPILEKCRNCLNLS
jgi:radical SAM protein with 4Fe4S-binding SPASM domain